jgi:hypothetical protein
MRFSGRSNHRSQLAGMCRYIARHANVIIAQVDFRLAPEYPVPTQVNDCFDAYKWVRAVRGCLRRERFFFRFFFNLIHSATIMPPGLGGTPVAIFPLDLRLEVARPWG